MRKSSTRATTRSRNSFSWLSGFALTFLFHSIWINLALCQSNLTTAPKTEKQLQVESLLKGASDKASAKLWDAAIQDCTAALEVDPTNTAAYLARCRIRIAKGEAEDAFKDLDLLLAQTSRDAAAILDRAEAFCLKSKICFDQGEYLKAIDHAYFATLEKGDYSEAHRRRAMAYLARQQYDKALDSANRAIQIDEKDAEALSLRGMAYTAKKNLPQALADQNKAISMAPQLPAAYQRRAAIGLAQGDLKSALQDVEHALQLKPDFIDALCDRAYLRGLSRDSSKALADVNAAIKIHPRCAKAHFVRGAILVGAEKFDQAITSLDESIRLQDKNAIAFCTRGLAKHGQEKFEEAVKDFTRAIEIDPNLVDAYQGRGKSLVKLKRIEEARADASMVKKLTPEPTVKKPESKKTAKKKQEEAKKKEEDSPRFLVKSKPVDPSKLERTLIAAKKIDALVSANYKLHSVKPNPRTTDEQFVRRIYLDITGTIPTFQETSRFLASTDADKRSKLIDQLLSSDGYASHYFNFWSDILRYTDNLNGNVRGEPYRQWIKQSLAENKPWNRMVYEMLTAEGLVWENPASGYLQRDANMPLDNMNNTIRIFLGTRIGCAQCHNHPFDRWTQKEFYQIAAFTYGTQTQTVGADTRFWKTNPNERLKKDFDTIEQEEEDRRNNSYRLDRVMSINQMIVNDVADRKVTLPKDYGYPDGKPNELVEPKVLFGKPVELRKGESLRKGFARWVVQKDNPRFALTLANRLWKQSFGVGQIEPVDDMMDSTVAENPALMSFLESELKELQFDMKEFLRAIYHSETYQRQASVEELQTGQPYHFPGPVLRRMTAEQVWDSFVTLAVPNPFEYRELPHSVRTDALAVNLDESKADDLLEAERKSSQVDGDQWRRQQKNLYKGVLMARASELPSPVPPNHFLRVFGQSDRELISASSTAGSVPQVLFMFNGPITHMLLEKNSTIYNNIVKKEDVKGGIRALFLTILNRLPDDEEVDMAEEEIRRLGPAGYGNVVWSLVNTREFLFIQ